MYYMSENTLHYGDAGNDIDFLSLFKRSYDSMLVRTSPALQGFMRDTLLSPESLDSVHRVYMNMVRLQGQLHNLTEIFSAPGRVSVQHPMSYNPKQFLKCLTEYTTSLICDSSIEITYECDNAPENAVFDLQRTSLILYNLLSNAIIHSTAKIKKVCVSVAIKGESLILSVTNNGRSIPPAKRDKLFSAYDSCLAELRNDIPLYTVRGLGLAASRAAAAAMNAELKYVPSHRGTRFDVIIPQPEVKAKEVTAVVLDYGFANACLASAIIRVKLGE